MPISCVVLELFAIKTLRAAHQHIQCLETLYYSNGGFFVYQFLSIGVSL